MDEPSWNDFVSWILNEVALETRPSRPALRKRWRCLSSLAEKALAKIDKAEIEDLLGKNIDELDPETRDLKAVVAYARGKNVLDAGPALREALHYDERADPLSFLLTKSGKSLGETWAPKFASFWLQEED